MGGTIWVIEGAPPPGESRGPHFITQAPIEVLNLLPSAYYAPRLASLRRVFFSTFSSLLPLFFFPLLPLRFRTRLIDERRIYFFPLRYSFLFLFCFFSFFFSSSICPPPLPPSSLFLFLFLSMERTLLRARDTERNALMNNCMRISPPRYFREPIRRGWNHPDGYSAVASFVFVGNNVGNEFCDCFFFF